MRNTVTGKTYPALPAAVEAASRGAHLTVRGTCVGRTVISKSLDLAGVQGPGSGKPTLTGARKSLVVVVAAGARVRLRDLKIVRGATADGGCIINRGDLVLRDAIVHYCYPTDGIGPFGGAHNLGRLTLNGRSRITRSGPGGVFNEGVLVLNGQSSIYGNGTQYGAAGVVNLGTFVMNGSSSISRNFGQYTGGVDNYGTMTMNDTSSIEGNGSDGEYGYASGGVYNGVTGPGLGWPEPPESAPGRPDDERHELHQGQRDLERERWWPEERRRRGHDERRLLDQRQQRAWEWAAGSCSRRVTSR